jgi:hypothetical protein
VEANQLAETISGLLEDLKVARAEAAAAIARRDMLEVAITSLKELLDTTAGALDAGLAQGVTDGSDRSGAARATVGLTASAVGTAHDPSVVVTPGPRLKGKKALLAVMREHAGRDWNAAELVRELERRGWAPDSPDPEAVTRVTLRRLVLDRKGVEKVGYGRYAYHPREVPLRAKQ